jgi:hypothetical protein
MQTSLEAAKTLLSSTSANHLHRETAQHDLAPSTDPKTQQPLFISNCHADAGSRVLALEFAGEWFLVCQSATHALTHVVGEDLEMHVEYLSDTSLVPAFTIPRKGGMPTTRAASNESSEPLECPELVHEHMYTAAAAAASATMRITNPSAENVHSAALEHLLSSLREQNHAPPSSSSSSSSSLSSSSSSYRQQCKMQRKKPCLFVHGAGQWSYQGVQDSFRKYWGDIANHAPCCSHFKFARFNMLGQAWTDTILQDQFCAAAQNVSRLASSSLQPDHHPDTQRPLIGDLILVSYSMGTLVISGALAEGRCHLSENVTWVSLGGPNLGSKAASVVVEQCRAPSAALKSVLADINQKYNDSAIPNTSTIFNFSSTFMQIGTVLDTIVAHPLRLSSNKKLAKQTMRNVKLSAIHAITASIHRFLDYCPLPAYPALVAYHDAPDAMKLKYDRALIQFQQHVTRILCGVNPVGLHTMFSAPLLLSHHVSGFAKGYGHDDGIVDFDSCRGGVSAASFGGDPETSYHYKGQLNHMDVALRNGDGWWGIDRKPLKWFERAL